MLLVSPIEIIITSEYCKSLKQEFILEYIKIINEAVNKEDNEVNYIFIVFCGQSLFIRDSYSEDIKEIIKATMGSLIKLSIRLLARASAEKSIEDR
jgi:hypothetical protein